MDAKCDHADCTLLAKDGGAQLRLPVNAVMDGAYKFVICFTCSATISFSSRTLLCS
jgi:hypothetical protein